jgi:hypothetical protein
MKDEQRCKAMMGGTLTVTKAFFYAKNKRILWTR